MTLVFVTNAFPWSVETCVLLTRHYFCHDCLLSLHLSMLDKLYQIFWQSSPRTRQISVDVLTFPIG